MLFPMIDDRGVRHHRNLLREIGLGRDRQSKRAFLRAEWSLFYRGVGGKLRLILDSLRAIFWLLVCSLPSAVLLSLAEPWLIGMGLTVMGIFAWSVLIVLHVVSLTTLSVCAWSWLRQRRHRTVAKAVGRCACCDYLLRAVPASDDGLTVCPECGAAWRLALEER